MKTRLYSSLRALPLLALVMLICGTSSAQSAFPNDPHDPNAYVSGVGMHKSSATPGLLLSKVNYTTRQDTLSAYDSSRITYNAAGTRIDELRTFRRDGDTWRPYDRFTYSFNSSGFNDQTVYEFWDPLRSAYFPVSRYSYMHDASGNKSQLFYEVWTVGSGGYKNGFMENYAFSPGNLVTRIHQQIWSVTTAAWENSNLETMSYNAQGKMSNYTIQTWNFNLGAWENKRQTISSYDASGTVLAGAENHTWGGPSLGWLNKSRTVNSIAGGKVTQQLIDDYDNVTKAWIPYSRETMSYLGTGMLGSSVMAGWVRASGSFADQTRATYTYNSDDQPKRVLTLVRAHGSWAVAAGAGETIYYYEGEKPPIQLGAGTAVATTPTLLVSPVPAADIIRVQRIPASAQSCTIVISDMSGRVLIRSEASFSAQNSVSIDVRELPAGSYVLCLTDGKTPGESTRFSILR